MIERWLPVPDYEGLYEVSDLGRVRSLHKRFHGPRLCALGLDGSGYTTVALSRDGRRTAKTVHRLVALAFHADKRNALHNEVAHLDGSRTNCRADNLKWVSKRENMSHKRLHGTAQIGSRHPRAKLTEAQVLQIFEHLLAGTPRRSISEMFGITPATVDDIRSGARWKHLARPKELSAPRSTGTGQSGADNHNARFSTAEVSQIRARRAEGATYQQIANEFGVWKGTIWRIATGQAYPEKEVA